MEVRLTSDQESFIRQHVRNGRFATAEEAVQEAISLLQERESDGETGRTAGTKSLRDVFEAISGLADDLDCGRNPSTGRPTDLV